MSSLDNPELANKQQMKLKKCTRLTTIPKGCDIARVNNMLDKELCEELLEQIRNKKDLTFAVPHGKNRYEQYVDMNNELYKKVLDIVSSKVKFERLHTFTIAFSLPGSETQPLHRDFRNMPYKPHNVLISLQDMKPEYGATMFIPETNKETWYEQYEKNEKTIALPYIQEILKQGDAMVYDGDILHCGTANTSDDTRIIIMIAFIPYT